MNLAFDLFLLMFNLAQLHEREKIIELFVGGMEEAFKPAKFRYSKEKTKSELSYDIRTRENFFGSIEMTNPDTSPTEYPLLVQNAVLMLGIILERLVLSERLEEEKNYYKNAANQRFEELEKNIKELNEVKGASINLINDLTEEIESRIRIEKQLSERDDQILLLLNSTAEAIYGLDVDGNCTFCNNASLRMLGYSEASELIGKNMHNQIHHTKKDKSPYPVEECKIYKSFNRGEPIHEESEVIWRKDGTSFFAEYWSHPIKREGEIVGSVVTFVDITERKKAEEAFEEKAKLDKQISIIATTAPGALCSFRTSPDGVSSLPYVSAAWQELTGLSQEQVANDAGTFFNIVHPEDVQKNIEAIEKSARTMTDWENVFRIIHPQKGELWIEGHSTPTKEEDGSILWHGFISDVTERKRAEENLRETSEFLESLIRYANAPIIVWDNNLKITKFNVAFEELTGRKKEEVTGERLEVLFPEEKREKSLELIKKASLGMQWETVEIEILHISGERREVLWNSANIYDSKKEKIIATIAQGNDITERKAAEEKLLNLNDRLHILVEAVKGLSEARSLETIEKIITKYAKELSHADGTTVIIKEGEYCHYAEEESTEPLWKNQKLPVSECISGWAMEHKKAVVIKDIYKDERISLSYYEKTFVRSLTILPIRTPEAIAAIGCYWKSNYEPTVAEMQLLQTLADSAGRPIENVRLYNELEKKVEEKTLELQERFKELERFHDATINRELRIKELRNEIAELKRRLQNG